jgi:hypothetical protein
MTRNPVVAPVPRVEKAAPLGRVWFAHRQPHSMPLPKPLRPRINITAQFRPCQLNCRHISLRSKPAPMTLLCLYERWLVGYAHSILDELEFVSRGMSQRPIQRHSLHVTLGAVACLKISVAVSNPMIDILGKQARMAVQSVS